MDLNIWIAFWGGFLSFLSPCTLPLYPSYLSYITSVSVTSLRSGPSREVRRKTLIHTLFFIIGFSIIYFALGAAAGAVSTLFSEYQQLISQLAAILIVLMGLFLLGIFQPELLLKERKFSVKARPAGYLGSVLIGIGFAAGWSPCVGPILSAILSLSAAKEGSWLPLILAYIAGFAIPFFVMALFIGSTRWILKYTNVLMKTGGAIMILMGILLYTGQLAEMNAWMQRTVPGFA